MADPPPTDATAAAALEKAQLDNDASRLANQKASQDLLFAAQNQAASLVKGAAAALSNVPQNGLDLPDGYVFHGAELSDRVLDDALQKVSTAVKARMSGKAARIFITDGSDLADSAILYAELLGRAKGMQTQVQTALEQVGIVAGGGGALGGVTALVSTISQVAAVGAAAASLLNVDTSLSGATTAASQASVQLQVAHYLLVDSALSVTVETYATVAADSPLLQIISSISDSLGILTRTQTTLQQKQDALDTTDTAGRAELASKLDVVAGQISSVSSYLSGVTAVPTGASKSPLATVLAREPILRSGADAEYALILSEPAVTLDQAVIKRRIFRSRIAVSAFAHVGYLLLRDGYIHAAGTTVESFSLSVKFRGRGPKAIPYTIDGTRLEGPGQNSTAKRKKGGPSPSRQGIRTAGKATGQGNVEQPVDADAVEPGSNDSLPSASKPTE